MSSLVASRDKAETEQVCLHCLFWRLLAVAPRRGILPGDGHICL